MKLMIPYYNAKGSRIHGIPEGGEMTLCGIRVDKYADPIIGNFDYSKSKMFHTCPKCGMLADFSLWDSSPVRDSLGIHVRVGDVVMMPSSKKCYVSAHGNKGWILVKPSPKANDKSEFVCKLQDLGEEFYVIGNINDTWKRVWGGEGLL